MIRRLARAWKTAASTSFVSNSLALISGTVLTQAIVFLFAPLLSRIYGLTDFGNLANYNAWAAILALASSLRYEHAIIVAKGRREMNRVVALTLTLTVASALLFAALAAILRFGYGGEGYLRDLREVAVWIPIGVLPTCLSSLFTQLNVRLGRFRLVAVVATVQVVFTILPQLLLGLLKTRDGLIIGTIIGFAGSSLVYAVITFREGTLRHIGKAITRRQLLVTARQFANFPRYTMAADALTVVMQQFIPVFVMALFNPVAAGLYSFSTRIIRVPAIVVSTAVNSVLRKEAMDRLNGGKSLAGLYRATVGGLAVVAVAPFLLMMLYSTRIFAVVFGEKWHEAGHIVQILSVGMFAEFVAYPLAAFFLVTGTQRYTFRVQLAGFIAMVGALFVGQRLMNDFTSSCYLISAVMVAVNLVSIALASRVTRSLPASYVGSAA